MDKILATLLGASVCWVLAIGRPCTATPTLKTIYSFTGLSDGGSPVAGVIAIGSYLYGVTPTITGPGGVVNHGTIFRVNIETEKETVLYSFSGGLDGGNPMAALSFLDGKFYGVTAGGGQYKKGTLFQFSVSEGKVVVLHSFTGGGDGAYPLSALTYLNGQFYGTTSAGGLACGNAGCGTIFAFDAAQNELRTLHVFAGRPDGAIPLAPLLNIDGLLYGTTSQGGSKRGFLCGPFGCGAVFVLNPGVVGSYAIIHSFLGELDGAAPQGALVAEEGQILGATTSGGVNACAFGRAFSRGHRTCGTVFALNVVSHSTKSLTRFDSADGGDPVGGLNVHPHMTLGTPVAFGTTMVGGSGNAGVVFSDAIHSDGAVLTVLHSFNDQTDGSSAVAPLIEVGKTLYGTTTAGGSGRYGTIFSLTQ